MLRETRGTRLTERRRGRRSGTRKESEEGRDGGGSGCSGQVKAQSRRETHTHRGKKKKIARRRKGNHVGDGKIGP